MMNPQTARMLTLGLAGTCGLLLLIAIAQQFGVGRGYHWSTGGEVAADDLPSAAGIQQDVAALGPESQYLAVRERPLLNEDRKPTPVDDSAAPSDVPQVPLNVTLTGVIITPDVKLAMLRDNVKGDPLSLREGMPLPGDQSVWTVVEILPRKVVLKSANNETNELPLDVAAVTPPATTPTAPRMPTPPPGAPPQVNAPPPMAVVDPNATINAQNDRAAELQKRIEERRREMREQAERLRQQQANPQDQQKQESE